MTVVRGLTTFVYADVKIHVFQVQFYGCNELLVRQHFEEICSYATVQHSQILDGARHPVLFRYNEIPAVEP